MIDIRDSTGYDIQMDKSKMELRAEIERLKKREKQYLSSNREDGKEIERLKAANEDLIVESNLILKQLKQLEAKMVEATKPLKPRGDGRCPACEGFLQRGGCQSCHSRPILREGGP